MAMADNKKMLEKHEDWDKKVKVVGLSVDNEMDKVKGRVTNLGWLKIKHYKNGWDVKTFPSEVSIPMVFRLWS